MSREEATAMDVRGGAPVGLGGDGRAEELRDVEKKLARGWVGGEEERRRGLRVEVGLGASNGGRRSAVLVEGALGFGSGRRGGCCEAMREGKSELGSSSDIRTIEQRQGNGVATASGVWRRGARRGAGGACH